jgi:hypothetical protein
MTEVTEEVESFHPIATTFRSPAFCAPAYFTPIVLPEAGSSAAF